jgi:hypothetical protein
MGDAEFLAVDRDIDRGPDEGAISEKRKEGNNHENNMFLPLGPLRLSAHSLKWHWKITWRGSLGSSDGTGYNAWPYAVSSPSAAVKSTVPGMSPSWAWLQPDKQLFILVNLEKVLPVCQPGTALRLRCHRALRNRNHHPTTPRATRLLKTRGKLCL